MRFESMAWIVFFPFRQDGSFRLYFSLFIGFVYPPTLVVGARLFTNIDPIRIACFFQPFFRSFNRVTKNFRRRLAPVDG